MYGNTVLELKRLGFGEERNLLNTCMCTLLLAKNAFAVDESKQSKAGALPNPAVPWVHFSGDKTQQDFARVSTEVKVFTFCPELNSNMR